MKPLSKVVIKWSPEFAYAIGLLVTDGCLSSDGRHFDFTSKDKDQILTFSRCLGLRDIKIGKKKSGFANSKEYFRVQFGDVIFYRWLNDLGLTSKKSKTIGSLKIPDKYFFDFLRGCFDGDGSMYAYWDPRWRSSYMFYMQFVSASSYFLKWLQDSIFRLAHICGRIQSGGRSVQQLRFAKAETRVLFDKMFYSADIPFLERKFLKAQTIFNVDKEHI